MSVSLRCLDANPRILLISSVPLNSLMAQRSIAGSSVGSCTSESVDLLLAVPYEVDVFNDISDGVMAFSESEYDIVLFSDTFERDLILAGISAVKLVSEERVVPVILLLRDISGAYLSNYISAGADDFLTYPLWPDILLAKLRLSNQMRLMHATVQYQRDQIRIHNDHLLQEQQVAKRIYDNITSGGCLAAENLRFFMSPMAMFNGDILVAAMRPSGNMLILLGDFTGHGLPAAIGAIPLASTFYGMAHKGFEPEDILREINQKIKAALPVGFFCCACMVELDLHEHTVLVWNGGMPDVYLLHEESGIEVITSTHVPLGVLDNRQFDARFVRYGMSLGDKLYLWTDGIIEATNAAGEMFGEDSLKRIFEQVDGSDDFMRDVCLAVDEFIGESDSSDDVSIVEICMVERSQLHVKENVSLAQQATQSAPTDWTMRFEITPQAVRSASPIPMMLNVLMEVPGLRQHSSSIYTILTELYSNALEHGILGLDSGLKASATGFVDYYTERDARLQNVSGGNLMFELRHEANKEGGALSIRVQDSGQGFDYLKSGSKMNDLSGRGIGLVGQLCQSLNYCGAGNEVQAVYHWGNHQ